MGVEVKKISVIAGQSSCYAITENNATIKPDSNITLGVTQWENEELIENITQEPVYWFWKDPARPIEVKRRALGRYMEFSIPKKLCGSFTYLIESSTSGILNENSVKDDFYINGYTKKQIVSSEWRAEPEGSDIRQSPIKYGDFLYLWLNTEGLNGDTITIEVYNRIGLRSDPLITSKTDVKVIDGEALYTIGDTTNWMGKVSSWWDEQEFYINVKDSNGNLVLDGNDDDAHARYLRILYEEATDKVHVSTNITPTKIYQAEVNAIRYDPCKFEKIIATIPKITDGQKGSEDITIFAEGQVLENPRTSTQQITRSVLFDFNDSSINPVAEEVANNVLGFLLDNVGTQIKMKGYACAIGSVEINQELSQLRSDAVKDFFVQGGLEAGRIISLGLGELNSDSPDNISKINDPEYINSRRVDITFDFRSHGANPVIFEIIAPSTPDKITLTIEGLNIDDCYRETNIHENKVIVKSPDLEMFEGSGSSVNFPIKSTLSTTNPAPLQYIWPKWNLIQAINRTIDSAAVYKAHIHSCRYYSNKNNETLLIKAYPDIKWELAFELIINTSNYRAANMPAGSIYTKHQEKSRKAGYEKWLMNKQGKVPISLGVGLSAEWDGGNSKRSLTNEFSTKIETLANVIATSADIVQGAINYAQSAAKQTAIPVGLDVRYPKFTTVANWLLETNSEKKVGVVGIVGFGFKPLIGAEIIIDIIGMAIAAVSYGTTGNPAAARLINKFRGGLETLGAKVVFTATFYGELEMMVDALKITNDGIDMQGKSTIGGKMGVKIGFELSIEIGKTSGKKLIPIDVSFKAAAYAEAFFGGDFIIDSDKNGMFVQPVLKFSGVMLAIEIEGEVGWWKSNFKIEEKIIEEDSKYLEKTYIT